MQFTPKTEKEIAAERLWAAGEYRFEVIDKVTMGGKEMETCDANSKKRGEGMIQLVLRLRNEKGDTRIILDFLLGSIARKLRQAACACGLLEEYASGELSAAQFIGKTGMLKLKVEKDKSGQYADKNAVAAYVL